jgi:DNA-directed RNA polymerase subunit H (RpoH/RPB5)
VDDLFISETVLDKRTDTLILISDDEPNDMIRSKVEYLFNHDGIFVVIHNIKRLQFNLLKHKDVPPVRALTEEEQTELMKKYRIDASQLPSISRFDPVSLAICLRPGQVCVFKRNSVVALETDFYRICE